MNAFARNALDDLLPEAAQPHTVPRDLRVTLRQTEDVAPVGV